MRKQKLQEAKSLVWSDSQGAAPPGLQRGLSEPQTPLPGVPPGPGGVGGAWMGRAGEEGAFAGGRQHVQMHGGGHVRKTGRGLITPKKKLKRVLGRVGLGAPVVPLCPVER